MPFNRMVRGSYIRVSPRAFLIEIMDNAEKYNDVAMWGDKTVGKFFIYRWHKLREYWLESGREGGQATTITNVGFRRMMEEDGISFTMGDPNHPYDESQYFVTHEDAHAQLRVSCMLKWDHEPENFFHQPNYSNELSYFLLQLLTNFYHTNYIKWIDQKEQIFQILDVRNLFMLMMRKHNAKIRHLFMFDFTLNSYDCVGILKKIDQLTYQFNRNFYDNKLTFAAVHNHVNIGPPDYGPGPFYMPADQSQREQQVQRQQEQMRLQNQHQHQQRGLLQSYQRLQDLIQQQPQEQLQQQLRVVQLRREQMQQRHQMEMHQLLLRQQQERQQQLQRQQQLEAMREQRRQRQVPLEEHMEMIEKKRRDKMEEAKKWQMDQQEKLLKEGQARKEAREKEKELELQEGQEKEQAEEPQQGQDQPQDQAQESEQQQEPQKEEEQPQQPQQPEQQPEDQQQPEEQQQTQQEPQPEEDPSAAKRPRI